MTAFDPKRTLPPTDNFRLVRRNVLRSLPMPYPSVFAGHASLLANILQDPKTLILVRDVDVSARIDEDIFGLDREAALRKGAVPLFRVGRNEVADLTRHGGRADVIDPQAGIEIGQVEQVSRFLNKGVVVQLVLVVGSKPATVLAKAFDLPVRRRNRQR